MVIVKTLPFARTLVSKVVEKIEEASEGDAKDDEEAGLRHLGRYHVGAVEAKLSQAGQDDEPHHGQVVFHLFPSPSDQARNWYNILNPSVLPLLTEFEDESHDPPPFPPPSSSSARTKVHRVNIGLMDYRKIF